MPGGEGPGLVLRLLGRSWTQRIGVLGFLAFVLAAVFAPLLTPYDPIKLDAAVGLRPPSLAHPFGTDQLGRDVLTRVIYAARIDLQIGLIGVAMGDPGNWLFWTIAFSFALGIAGATQDITVDGWRITAAPKDKLAMMTSITEIGYRVGTLVAGAGALYLAYFYGWRVAYLTMAAIMLFGLTAALVAPEPPSDIAPHRERHVRPGAAHPRAGHRGRIRGEPRPGARSAAAAREGRARLSGVQCRQ